MVAQVNREMFSEALLTPRPDPSDSEEVLRAIETARQLEARGDIREAVQCLRRAADAAEKQSNDERVLVLARAAAELTNRLGPASLATASASPPAEATAIPPMLAALVASVPVGVHPSSAPPRPERKMRIGSVRVAFAGSMQESSFVVHRLATGQPTPEGMTEAILVLTGDVEGRVEIETTLRVVDRSTAKS